MNKDVGEITRSGRLRSPLLAPADPVLGGSSPPERGSSLGVIGNAVRRRKGFIAAFALCGLLLVGIAAFIVPPSYTATAQLMIEPTPAEVQAGVLAPVIDTHITMLTSDARLRRVLEDLAKDPDFVAISTSADTVPTIEEQIRGFLTGMATQLKNAIVPVDQQAAAGPDPGAPPTLSLTEVKDALLVRQERLSSIVAVSFRDKNPQKAAMVVNQIVKVHIEGLLGRRQHNTERLRSIQDQRIREVEAELQEAEKAVKGFYAAHGTGTVEKDGEPIAEVIRQLTLVRSEISRRQARLDHLTGTPRQVEAGSPPGAEIETGGIASNGQAGSEPALRELEQQIRIFRLRAETLEQRLKELHSTTGVFLGQHLDQQALELRVTSARKLLDDLLQRRGDAKEAGHPFAAEAQKFALASVPARPSSINPYLLLPPGVVAFGILGVAVALMRDRLDRSFRREHDVADALGIPCIGLIPKAPGSHRRPDHRSLIERPWLPYSRAVASIVLTTLHLSGRHRDTQTVLITSSGCDDDKGGLATSFGVCAARLGRRVLLIGWRDDATLLPRVGDDPPGKAPSLQDEMAATAIEHDSELGLDRLSASVVSRDLIRALASDRFSDILHILRSSYDCVVIDAPSVLASTEVRLLAQQVDGVLLAVQWARTKRDIAANAVDLLQQPGTLAGDSSVNALAVLTGVDLKAHARFRYGDVGEHLFKHRRRPARRERSA